MKLNLLVGIVTIYACFLQNSSGLPSLLPFLLHCHISLKASEFSFSPEVKKK